MEIERLSSRYAVRALGERDAEAVFEFCRQHRDYYLYCAAEPSLEQVRRDMALLPEGVSPEQKHYLGFFDGAEMVAVMDFIEVYPDDETCYIGFFMMDHRLQGRGLGSAIIAGAADCFRSMGVRRLRLAIASDNPQANHFWKKNGFQVVKSVEMDGWTALVADRVL